MLKELLPPILTRFYARWRHPGLIFTGPYESWNEAAARSTGYAPDSIAERVRDAVREVRAGRAAYERDSILFHDAALPFPVLSGLLRAALRDGGRLSVLDFGGSLGSAYFQCRRFLRDLVAIRWSVVEQDAFVRYGKEFESDELVFYRSIRECIERERPSVALLSGVLQYLEDPYRVLDELSGHGFAVVLIDRTPFCMLERDLIAVQKVPPAIYDASYPIRLFGSAVLTEMLGKEYARIAEFPAVDGIMHILGQTVHFKGAIFEPKESRKWASKR